MIHAALTAAAALTLYLTTATLGWMALKSVHHPLEQLRDVDSPLFHGGSNAQ